VSICVQCQDLDAGEEVCDEGSKGINEQASYAATKLRQLYDKLEYKRQALGSIQNAPKPDKKVTNYKPWITSGWQKTHKHKFNTK